MNKHTGFTILRRKKRLMIKFNGRKYKSQLSLTRYLNYVVDREADEKFNELLEMIQHHPNAKEKIGKGIKRFYSKLSLYNKHQMMPMIERVDGTRTDFSIGKCVRVMESTKKR